MHEGREKFMRALAQARQAITLSFNERLWLPTLVLMYALIDAMAWLSRDPAREDVTREDFIAWCDRYLLVPPDPACSGVDLYAARCGIVHSHVAESRLMRDGQARPLWYELPTGETLIPIHTSSQLIASTIRLQPFIARVFGAADSFLAAVDTDPQFANLVWERADLYYDVGVMMDSGRPEVM